MAPLAMVPQPEFKEAKFPLGEIIVTTGAYDVLLAADLKRGLFWHGQGVWGDAPESDREANDRALASGDGGFQSVYAADNGTVFWVITESDRSTTTILLPDEY